jgi:multidrug efflux pump
MKLETLIKSLIRNKKITLFFVCLAIAAGILAYIAMPKQESPDFAVPYAMITTVFPGASQNDVDQYVTVPIDEAVQTVEGYDSSFSYSINTMSLVVLELKVSADKDEAFRQLKDTLTELQKELPKACGQIGVNTNITDTAGVLISLSSTELTNRQVTDQAIFVRDRLSAIEGFSRFEIIGSLDTVISVRMNETRMKAAGLTLDTVVSLIEAGNLDLPMGNITEDGGQVIVDYIGGYTSLDDVAGLAIGYSAQLNRVIRLQDVAAVTLETADRNTYYTHNGNQAVILAGYFDRDINVLPLKSEIQDALDNLKSELPESLVVSLIISQPEEIQESLVDFLQNLLVSVGLVILVMLIGMGFRNALVVSVSLPLSVLLSFLAMYLFGIKIHQISVAALVLSLGMLVDNSIVVSDSIQIYLDAGEKRMDACVKGVKSVALPIFTSTLTTIAAFAPFIFLNSIAGDYIRSLPQIVCIALTASYVSAVFAIPVLGFIFFKPKADQKKQGKKTAFRRLLDASMRHKAVVIAAVIVLVAGSAYLGIHIERIFFPASDKNILYIDVRNDVAGDPDSTRDIMGKLTDAVIGEPGVTETTASAGGALPRFNDIMYIYTQTPDIGQIMLRADLEKAGFKTNAEYKAYLQQKLDSLGLGARITVKQLMYAYPMNEDLRIRIVDGDLGKLKEYEREIYGLLSGMDGFIDESKGNIDFVNNYNLEIDGAKAQTNGIIPAEAENELSIAMLGREATYSMDGEYKSAVVVGGGSHTKEDLLAIPLKNAEGAYIAAGELVTLTKTQALSTIPRVDGDYAMTVTADYDLRFDKNASLGEAKKQIEALGIKDARIIYEGEAETIRKNFGQVGVLGAVALALVFVILLLQFKSFRMPLIIFITIPLSVIGSAVGLYLTDQPLSFTALLGVVSLMGIVVNNAIILMDYIEKELENGMAIQAACISASMRRLRPILLTSITTVIGLIPLAIGQSQLFKPMAVALMSGLLVSTMLTLIVIPVIVSLMKHKAKP